MLPCVNTKQRPELSDDRILIGIGLDPDCTGLCILHEPSPSRALNTRKCSVEFLFHGIEAAVGAVDGGCELARWGLTSAGGLGGEVLPEEAVVCVATCIMKLVDALDATDDRSALHLRGS